ncbi:hypothetical protein BS78_03G334400 [Paspalum vaginatum]|nr:hypothetical protein BS78_03G334400 [Paspalum vaginatum]
MIERVHSYDLLKTCIEDILSTIKPVEDDRKKRLSAIQELADTTHSVEALRGVARHMNFIPSARVPIIQYMSNHFGISCDISVNNYAGQIKSRIFYWINIMDERFGDMVLLVKEWAKAQNINDPKNGTLNSYSLCLLVIFHFQQCEPAILPPLKEIYDWNGAEEIVFYDENHVDEVCVANISRFLRQNMGQRNESSLSCLFAQFFRKFLNIWSFSSKVISTYTGRFEQIQDNPSWMAKSYNLYVEDPFERPDNAARTVGADEFGRIVRAFNFVNHMFTAGSLTDRDELLSLLCTHPVGSILGATRANRYTQPSLQLYSPVAANLYDDQHHQQATSSNGSRSSPQGYATEFQTARPDKCHKQPQAHNAEWVTPGQYYPLPCRAGFQRAVPLQYHDHTSSSTTGRQSVGPYRNQQRRWEYSPYQHAGTTRYEHAGGRWFHNGSTWNYASQSSYNAAWES